MKMKRLYFRSAMLSMLFLAAVPLGGCKASCGADSDVEDAVENVADKAEDAVDEIAD